MNSQTSSYDKSILNYYSCLYPLIHEYLIKHHRHSSLPLMINSELSAIPTCIVNDDGAFFIDFRKSKMLTFKSPESIFGYNIHTNTVHSFDKYETLMSIHLDIGDILASGTQYFLPCSFNYKAQSYIAEYPNPLFGVANHWLLITQMHFDSLIIRDATANFTGSISKTDFLNYWCGDKGIPELKCHDEISGLLEFGYAVIKFESEKNSKDIQISLLDTLNIILSYYLNGYMLNNKSQKIYFGWQANKQLLHCFEKVDPNDILGISRINQALLKHKFSRLFLFDLISECENIWSEYSEFPQDIFTIIDDLQNIAIKFSVYLSRKRINAKFIADTIQALKLLHEKEQYYMEKIWTITQTIAR